VTGAAKAVWLKASKTAVVIKECFIINLLLNKNKNKRQYKY
jgi:hypothetical protein